MSARTLVTLTEEQWAELEDVVGLYECAVEWWRLALGLTHEELSASPAPIRIMDYECSQADYERLVDLLNRKHDRKSLRRPAEVPMLLLDIGPPVAS